MLAVNLRDSYWPTIRKFTVIRTVKLVDGISLRYNGMINKLFGP